MKHFVSFLLTLCLCTLVACSEDNEGANDIQVSSSQSQFLNQTIDASTTTAASVTFTTTGAWYTQVRATRSSANDWLIISPNHGDQAGTYTIQISLTPNDTEEQRTAVITIISGESQIDITIVQKAKNDDSGDESEPALPNDPVYFSKFAGPKIKSIKSYNAKTHELLSTKTFVYNHNGEGEGEGLLTEFIDRWGDGEYDFEKYTFSYPKEGSEENKMFVQCDCWTQIYNGPNTGTYEPNGYEYAGYKHWMVLNEKGYVISTDSDEGELTLEYDGGQLVKIYNPDEGITQFTWENWTMVKKTYDDEAGYSRVTNYTPSKWHSNPFFYSQVDPTEFCREEFPTLIPWAIGITGGHNQSLYESISSNGIKVNFDYEFNGGEAVVNGNKVQLISRINVNYEGSSFKEYYILEYYK